MFPRLLHIGNFNLATYGVMAATGLLVALSLVVKAARREGLNPDKIWNLGILAILSSMVGAKLLMILDDWSFYRAHPSELFSMATLQAYGVFFGGLIVAIGASLFYIWRNRLPMLKTCDIFAPGIAIGHAIGRLGCFAAGCCYGKPTNLPWAVTFTNPLANQIVGTPLGIPLQPTQNYEFLLEMANFAFLWWLLKRKRFEGQVIGAYLFIYGFGRFFFEFLRDDPDRGSVFGGALSVVQVIAIFMVIAGGVLWMRGFRSEPKPVVATAAH